jgi:glycerate kinase
MTARTVLIAPDSFKGTFSAQEVAAAVGRGIAATGCRSDLCPVADGGEGTLEALVGALGGELRTITVADPLDRPVRAAFALLGDGTTAVVETAAASGLQLVALAERDPERSSTRGTGELLVAAARTGARRILLGVGGSATTDGGAGAIEAIHEAGGLGGATLEILCDVRTPYEDAARVFGPQKGARREAVARLTARLDQFAATLPRDPRGVPMTGAAGGLSGGLWGAFGADLRSGAAFVLDAVRFDARMLDAAAVVVGEGRLDAQTATGKIISAIVPRCHRGGVPVHAVVGSIRPDEKTPGGFASVTEASTLSAMTAAGRAIGRAVAAGHEAR